MKVKNLTPFPYGSKLTSRHPPQPEMVLVLRGLFDIVPGGVVTPVQGEIEGDPLAQGFLTGDVYRDDDDDLSGEILYGSDFADFKLNAEVLLRGPCYAPRGEPVERLGVRIGIGQWEKTIQVIGNRRWKSRSPVAGATDPEPFVQMPIDWAHAYGGPDYPLNPVGKGSAGDLLPNIESFDEPVTRRGSRPSRPAGLSAVSPRWSPRRDKFGKAYGADYLKKRAPYYSADFDWTFFHAAPADQQLPGYLRGDEEVMLQQLHPAHPVLTTQLPALRIRVFVKDDAGTIVELPMVLDTLCIDSEKQQLLLTWRGHCNVREDDLTDVAFAVIGSEAQSDEPQPASVYHEVLIELERDPTGFAAQTKTMEETRDRELAKLAEAEQALQELGQGGEAALGGQVATLVDIMSAPDPQRHAKITADVNGALAAKQDDHMPASAQLDLGAMLLKQGPKQRQPGASPPPLVIPEKGAPLPAPPDPQLALAIEQARRDAKQAEDEANAALAEAGRPPMEPSVSAKLEAMLDQPMFELLAPRPPVEPGRGRDLSRQDWRQRDLRGADLSHSNLSETLLTGADLRGARLAHANLSHAVLYQADLRGADLSETDLTLANFTQAQAEDVSLRNARAARTFLDEANLSGADLSGLKGEYLLVRQADLRRARLNGCELFQAFFDRCHLDDADLSQAVLTRCLLMQCELERAKLDGARLDKTSFGDCKAPDASFVGACGEGAIFMGAQLDRSDFSYAVLTAAHFDRVSAKEVRFYGANLKGSHFYRAVLTRADLTSANLFGADLRKSRLGHAKLVGANLYEAVLIGASGRHTDFRDANLNRCRLPES